MQKLPGKHTSFWLESTPSTSYPLLKEGISVDVIVVGAGIAGLLTALELQERGKRVVIVDANRIAAGVTAFTTAKISSAHGLIYTYLESHFGKEKTRFYAEANQWGIERIAEIATKYAIDCDLERMPAYIYTEKQEEVEQLEKETTSAKEAGLPVTFTKEVPLPFSTFAAVRYENQAQFHPRKFLLGVAKVLEKNGALLFEETRAMDIDEGEPSTLKTDQGTIKASDIVIATHFPFYDKGFYFTRMSQHRSYALGIKVERYSPEAMFWSESQAMGSMRSQKTDSGEILIVGGQDHKTGEGGNTVEHYTKLEEAARQKFKVKSVEYSWSTQDNMTIDRVPYIGLHIPTSKHVYVATGFSKWGMTHGAVAGRLISDLITDKENEWEDLYTPSRFKPLTSAKTFVSEGVDNAKHLLTSLLSKGDKEGIESINPGEGKVIEVEGQKLAVYKDENGTPHAISAICTHQGCTVEWNQAEQSWDCPCHGSRFTKDGEVIQGPALKDLEKKDRD